MSDWSFAANLSLSHHTDLQQRTRWYVLVRWFFIFSIAVPGIFSNFIGEGFSVQVKRDFILACAVLSSNLLFLFLSRRETKDSYYRNIVIAYLLIDIITITVLIFIKGGVESRSPILYTIPMLISSAIFSRRGVYLAAVTSIVLYDLLIILDWLGIVKSIGAVNPHLRLETTYVINTIAFFTLVLLVIATLSDFITQLLKNKEKQARSTTEALEEAQAISKLGSWDWDIAGNQIVWSKELYNIFGLDPKKFKATFEAYLDYAHPEDADNIKSIITKSLETLQPFSFDHRIKGDGEVRWVHSEGQVAADAKGKPIRMYGVAQDISDRKQAEAEIQSRSETLERMNQAMVGRELKMIELKQKLRSSSDIKTEPADKNASNGKK